MYGTAPALPQIMGEQRNRRAKVAVSGVLATAIDLVTLVLLVEIVGVPVTLAVFFAAGAGALGGFLVNKYWAFGDFSPLRLSQVALFGGVALGSALGVASAVQLFSVVCGANYLLAKGVGAALVFVCWSYPLQSRVVFRIYAS